MARFFMTQRTSHLALSAFFALGLPLIPVSAHALSTKERHILAAPHKKADDIFFIGNDRLPEELKEDKKHEHHDHEFIENDG